MDGSDRKRELGVEELRRRVDAAVRVSSLRTVAMQAGIGKTALHRFIVGRSIPFNRTRTRLEQWYLASGAAEPLAGLLSVDVAMHALTRHLPPGVQGAVRGEIAAVVARETLIHGAELPAWLRDGGEDGG